METITSYCNQVDGKKKQQPEEKKHMTQKGAIVRNSNDSPLASQKRVGQLQNEEKYLSI